MTDKSTPERIGIAETRIADLESRTQDLEDANENRKNWFIRQVVGLLKMILGVTALTFLTEMAKEGCRLCKIVIGYLTGGNA